MPDNFAFSSDSVFAPARSCFSVTPSDATDYANTGSVPKALYIGGAGDLVVQMVDDSATVTFTGLAAGVLLPIRPRRILADGTTCTAIVALA
jgi:hypothetical protein